MENEPAYLFPPSSYVPVACGFVIGSAANPAVRGVTVAGARKDNIPRARFDLVSGIFMIRYRNGEGKVPPTFTFCNRYYLRTGIGLFNRFGFYVNKSMEVEN